MISSVNGCIGLVLVAASLIELMIRNSFITAPSSQLRLRFREFMLRSRCCDDVKHGSEVFLRRVVVSTEASTRHILGLTFKEEKPSPVVMFVFIDVIGE